jgi:pyruvate,water dikinase
MRCDLDTDLGPAATIWTRANAGEVLPALVRPLGWSLVGPGFEEAFRISLCDDLRGLDREPVPYALTGRFAGYFHLNLSAIRVAAERLPGTSAKAVDVQYFGDAASFGLPAHERRPGDRRRSHNTGPALVGAVVRFPRRLRRLLAEVDAAVAANRALLARTPAPSDDELVAALVALPELFARIGGAHVTARALTSSALDTAMRALARGGRSTAEALALVASIPDLESAKPSRELAAIAAKVPPRSELASLLAKGCRLDELRTAAVEGAPSLAAAVDAFLLAHGHRGVNEYDPTVPAWEQQPDLVLAQVGALVGETEPPSSRAEIPALARPLVANARTWMRRAEQTKGALTRTTHEMRRIVHELERRWDDRLQGDDLAHLTLDEVAAVARGGAVPADAVARRRAELATAAGVRPREWSRGTLQVTDAVVASGATELQGIGGSPGTAVGRVRVLHEPTADIEDGDVLVTPLTDTAWTPLFLVASAVVTDIGGLLSHATIVARDLGIPAVVNTKTGTLELHDGDLVEVDGGAGTVKILSRA